jgi:ABC-type amino acid transport substrate-binding protein
MPKRPESTDTGSGNLAYRHLFINPPFECVSLGKQVGFKVDLMNEIDLRLHLKPFFVNTRWEVILQQMREGSNDCIIGGIAITPSRQETLRGARKWACPSTGARCVQWSSRPADWLRQLPLLF